MQTLELIVPTAKERLTIFNDVTKQLKESGALGDISQLAIESDERWVSKKKNILLHSMEPYDTAIAEVAKESMTLVTKKRKAPTVGNNLHPAKRSKELGMLRMRATAL
jgi:hypothetical protein